MRDLAFLKLLTLFFVLGGVLPHDAHGAPIWSSNWDSKASIYLRHTRHSTSHIEHSSSPVPNSGDSSDIDTKGSSEHKSADANSHELHHEPPVLSFTRRAVPVIQERDEKLSSTSVDVYDEYYNDLVRSWGSIASDEKSVAPLQDVLRQDDSSITNESTNLKRLDHLPPMGPGIELAPPSIHPNASGVHKPVAVLTAVAAIIFVILCCILLNVRHLLWSSCKARKSSPKGKRRLVMSERDRSAWRERHLSPSLPRPRYLSPPSPAPTYASQFSDFCDDGLRSPSPPSPVSPLPEYSGDLDMDIPPGLKSKWSMTTSDYAMSPRTSASSPAAHRSVSESMYLTSPPSLVSPPQTYSPLSFETQDGRASDASDYRFGHNRNRSAPVSPSIASIASIDGRSRSSSTSSGKVPRVQWQ